MVLHAFEGRAAVRFTVALKGRNCSRKRDRKPEARTQIRAESVADPSQNHPQNFKNADLSSLCLCG
jgi:hypothetical protein